MIYTWFCLERETIDLHLMCFDQRYLQREWISRTKVRINIKLSAVANNEYLSKESKEIFKKL